MTIFGNVLFFALLTGFFLFLFHNTLRYEVWWGKVLMSPFLIIASLFCDGLIFLMLHAISYSDPKVLPDSRKEIPIYSIGGGTSFSVSGRFVLGAGAIDGTTKPSYRYYEFINGKYHLNEIPAENFGIICTNLTEPKIVINATKEGMEPKLTWIFKETYTRNIENDKLTGTIYIPEGSVIQSYEIKL